MSRAPVLAVVLALACSGADERCDVAQLGKLAAPVGADDCGTQDPGGTDVDTCMAGHLRDGVPFVGVTQEAGVLDLVARSWVYDGTTVTLFLGRFTSCTSDGCLGEVEQLDCPAPVPTFDGDAGTITCTWPTAPCGPIVCGGDGDGCAI
jgi:hypothetical protein